MIDFFVGNILFRFVPTKIAVGALKRLRIDLRTTWEWERLYFLNSDMPMVIKKAVLVLYYWLTPFERGVAWGCAMESSFRVMSLATLYREVDSEAMHKLIAARLKVERRFIEQNLETHSFNNHYMFNVAALYVCNVLLEQKDKADKWERATLETISLQFNQDGSNFEASTAYHLLVLELLAQVIFINPACKSKIMGAFDYKGAIDFAFLCKYNKEDIWLVGDNDSSACVGGGANKRGKQYAKIASMFSYWPNVESSGRLFDNFGVFFYSDELINFALWNSKIGQNGKGGHNHNDCLSITCSVAGRAFLIDPGVYKYSRRRNAYRSAGSHSLARPIGFEHENFISNFELSNSSRREVKVSKCAVLGVFSNRAVDLSREIVRTLEGFNVCDISSGKDPLEVIFTLHPAVRVTTLEMGKKLALSREDVESTVYLMFDAGIKSVEEKTYTCSTKYGAMQPSKKISVTAAGNTFKWRLAVV